MRVFVGFREPGSGGAVDTYLVPMRVFVGFREPGSGGAADIYLVPFTGETCWRGHLLRVMRRRAHVPWTGESGECREWRV